ncbi:MAG: hypothetical protein DVS81_04525 [Candidatus Accumulibacter meliphilus]|jgi:hypothetical protein|uniref:Uncharacterized protein n=1 Tax=Candidatus Accumulibacter meliphilus TaxID=2211374 RepID=A0A369XSA8_9PROT|nr:MAG: hypothetical protein DVS81_04525 [Candidatus Accumulibacter meliphilus]
MNHRLLDYQPPLDALEQALEAPGNVAGWSSANEMRVAAELLEHADEGVLESYLDGMIGGADGRAVASDVRAALAGILGRIGRPLLRQAGATPRLSAGRIFALELEGLSPEDQAFEVARHFGRFAADAARRASRATGTASAQLVARRAAVAAAQEFAPGLAPTNPGSRPSTGTWFRRGRQLVVLNP